MEGNKRQNERIERSVIEINWDAVDQNFAYSLQFSDDSTILVVNKPEFSTNPILIPEGVEIQRPDAVDEEIKILPMVLQKPDGGR